jgi:hypothetical protein
LLKRETDNLAPNSFCAFVILKNNNWAYIKVISGFPERLALVKNLQREDGRDGACQPLAGMEVWNPDEISKEENLVLIIFPDHPLACRTGMVF